MRLVLALCLTSVVLLPQMVADPVFADEALTGSQVLSQLVVAEPSVSAYDRAEFEHWVDDDHDGCDTRQEVLIAESTTAVQPDSGCPVSSGTWYSWFDDTTWTDPSDVDIDHMVPLSEAWKSGADQWSGAQRKAFANDLGLDIALEAVTDNINQSKGDRDPAQWLPPSPNAQCQYATNWVLVKFRWNLTVDTAEHSALDTILSGSCGDAPVGLPAQAGTSTPTPTPTSTPTPTATSTPSSTPAPAPGVDRLAGSNRYTTAVAISQEYDAGVNVVYVATGDNYPDALSAAPAAAKLGGPLLLTPRSGLPSVVRAEILRLQPGLIVVAGGVGVVSDAIYSELSGLAPSIRRDAGSNRYETSRIIVERAFLDGANTAFFATGANFPDALSASAAAGLSESPVILIDGSGRGVDSSTAALMVRLGVTSGIIAGGTGVVSSRMEASLRVQPTVIAVDRYAGSNRYLTSREINRRTFSTAPQAFFAVGTGFADALAGAALAGRNGAPLYVVEQNCIASEVKADLASLGTVNRVLLGGTGVLGGGVADAVSCGGAAPANPIEPTNPGDSKNCSDFSTWSAAQAWYSKYFPKYGDVARLDANNDGVACESLPGAP